MNERWAEAFTRKAADHWTPDRVEALTGGKRLAVLPSRAPTLLRALGLLHSDASMPPPQVRKYLQINHMVALLKPSLRALRERFETVRVLDAGCGRSYLTLLLAWCFVHTFDHPIEVLGVDRNAALIEACRCRAARAGLDDVVRYEAASLGDLDVADAWRRAFGRSDQVRRVDLLISLHACDTATDDAIGLGLAEEATCIAVAPCCQAELAAKWRQLDGTTQGAFAPLWSSPHLRRVAAATMTDTFRMLLLRAAGYDADAIEFVASTHTPKNTLIRATRPRPLCQIDQDALAAYLALRQATGGAGVALEALMPGPLRVALNRRGDAPG